VIYLSHYLDNDTPGYGGSKDDIKITAKSCMNHGDSSNSLKLELKNHVGTHIDLPRHFDPKGKTLNDYPAFFWEFFHVKLLDLPCEPSHLISFDELEKTLDQKTECLLVRTGFESRRRSESYWKENPGFLPETGKKLRERFKKLRIIGFDFISLTSYSHRELGREAHKAFLGPLDEHEPLLIMEDMKLSVLTKSPEKILVAPLLLANADGCPISVFASL
jgi:arylformamidase